MKIKNKIKAVSGIREHEGKKQIGFLMIYDETKPEKWFNVEGEEEGLKMLLDGPVQKGNTIEFEFKNGNVSEIVLVKKAEKQQSSSGAGHHDDDLVNFEDLLDAAHEKAKKLTLDMTIATELLESSFEKKTAIFKAIVILRKPDSEIITSRYEAHGDATDENIQGNFVKPHFLRMAETRAISRALRWFTNNAKCSDVETDQPTKKVKK